MTGAETRERIDREAAEWAARDAFGDMTEDDRAALEVWLAADRLHHGAYLRARAICHVIEDETLAAAAPRASNDDEVETRLSASRAFTRRLAGGGALAAGIAGLAFFAAPALWPSRAPDGQGGRTLHLADGSDVTLGPGGDVSANIGAHERRIELRKGSATFHVAKDASRPFIVRSGGVFAQATGTIYTVSRWRSSGGDVRVSEGTVRVWAENAEGKAVLLHAGQSLRLDPARLSSSVGGAGKNPLGVAADGKFWFDDVAIAEAAARFNKVNTVRIEIAEPALGAMTIVGGFAADQPEQFARAAAALAGARLTRREGILVIEKP